MAYEKSFPAGGFKPLTYPLTVRGGVGSGTLAGNIELTYRDAQLLRLDPGGSDRDVTLPPARDGALFIIRNTADAEEALTVKNQAAATVATIPRGGSAMVACEGSTWGEVMGNAPRPQVLADPGDAGAIPVPTSMLAACALVSAGAETRTLADPAYLGQRLALVCDTYVGDIVVTAASPINVANNTIMTFGAVSEYIELVAVSVGGALVWQVASNDGVGLT